MPQTGIDPTSNTPIRDALAVYLDHAGKYARLTVDEERSALRRLAVLRHETWTALLSSDPEVRAVGKWLAQEGHPELARGVLEARAGTRAVGELETLLVKLDAGTSDRLCGELFALADGQPSALDLERSATFDEYVGRVRQTDVAYKRARNRFLCANLRLVVHVANRYANTFLGMADRVQEGNLGLVRAVDRFDVERETRFSTYAVWWIRHFITQALIKRGRNVRIPAHLHRMFMKARKVESTLEVSLGRKPTPDEVACEIGADPSQIADAERAMTVRTVGLDAPVDPESTRTIGHTLVAPPLLDVDAAIDEQRHLAQAREALATLEARQRDILRRRFGLDGDAPWTLRRLGELHSVSRERIRQLQNNGLRTLQEAIS